MVKDLISHFRQHYWTLVPVLPAPFMGFYLPGLDSRILRDAYIVGLLDCPVSENVKLFFNVL